MALQVIKRKPIEVNLQVKPLARPVQAVIQQAAPRATPNIVSGRAQVQPTLSVPTAPRPQVVSVMGTSLRQQAKDTLGVRLPKVESLLNQGRSFEDISDQTGAGIAEVRDYTDRNRPGYGVKKTSLMDKAGQFVKDSAYAIGMAGAKPFITANTKDQENAYEAAKGAYDRGEITNQKFYETTGQLAEGVIGKKTTRDDNGIVRVVDKTPVEFAQEFTDAGVTAAGVIPIARGGKIAFDTAGMGAKKAAKELAKEGLTWGTVDTANDVVQGRFTPEGAALNYGVNMLLPATGYAVGRPIKAGVDKFVKPTVRKAVSKEAEEIVEAIEGGAGLGATAKPGTTERTNENLSPVKLRQAPKATKPTNEITTVNPTGTVHTEYTPGARVDAPLGKNITTLDKTAKRSGNEMVSVFRGAPANQKGIVPGDFVTTNKQLAQDYAGNGNVLETKVKLKELLDDKTEPLGEEYIYRPKLRQAPVIRDAGDELPILKRPVNYDLPPKEGTIRLYTNTKGKNVDSILEGGLKTKQRLQGYGADPSEGSVSWFETTPNLKGYGGNTIAVDVPVNARMQKVNDTQYTVFDDIGPENIVFVDRPAFGEYRTSDVKGLVDKYGAEKVREVYGKSKSQNIAPEELDELIGGTSTKNRQGTKASDDNTITEEEMQNILLLQRQRFGDENVKVDAPVKDSNLGSYSYQEDMTRLVDGQAKPLDTYNHESIHKAIGQFLDDAEIEQLYKDMVDIRGGKLALQNHYRKNGYPDASWRTAAEEEIANAFVDFLQTGQTVIKHKGAQGLWWWAESKGLPKPLVEIFWKLYQAIDARYGKSASRQATATRLDDFYKKVEEGGFNGATRRDSRYYEPSFRGSLNRLGDRLIDGAAPAPARRSESGKPTAKLRQEPADLGTAYREAQDARAAQYSQSPAVKFGNKVQEQLFDPRNIEQRLDAAQFRAIKESGAALLGQKELLPSNALASIRGRIQNPSKAARIRDDTKYEINGNEYSLNDIIRIYGKDDSPAARDFENYRIFKDELERLDRGMPNTLGLDPAEMDSFVKVYEMQNPAALEHNAVLRQHQLDILAEKRDARIDNPELFDNSATFEFFNPRQALDPEDLVRQQMTGGVRSGAKGTQTRSETAGGPVRSPLSLFKERSLEAERSLAEQQYGLELRNRVDEGTIPGARVVVDAEVARQNKLALQEMRSLIDNKKSLVTLKNKTRGELDKAKSTAASDKKAIQFVRKYINGTNENDIFADLKGAELTDAEALDLFKVMAGQNVKNTGRLIKRISDGTGNTPEQVKDYLAGIRVAISETKRDIKDARETVSMTSQNLERGTQTYSYKIDGEVGKIELPADLANSLAKQNEAQNISMLEKGLQPVAAVQKLTWTGILQPAFKIWNTLVKNPILMYRNADGLSGIRPEAGFAILRQVVNTPKMREFKKEMQKRGAAYENILQTKNIQSSTADDIARRAGMDSWAEGIFTNPAATLQDVWKGINEFAAFPDNAQRTAVAYGAYKRAKGMGWSDEAALDIASQAPAKVFGDFDRISRLAQNLEIVIPYSGAIQAGTRAMYQATKTKPYSTTFKDAMLLSTLAGVTAYSLSNTKEGQDYYQDMIDSEKEYELDNNWTLVLPRASRDDAGNWKGVIKVPLLPDVRPMNRAAWQSTRAIAQGQGADVPMIAGELFNQLTGDISSNLYDPKRGEANPVNGVLPSSPLVNFGKTLAGVNMYDGNPLADEFTASRPRVEQVGKKTTEGAKTASKVTGGMLTPLQFDQIFNMIGSTGDILQQKEGANDPIANVLKPVQPGIGRSKENVGKVNYIQDKEVVGSTFKNADDFRAFQTLTSSNSVKSVEDAAARAKELLARPDVLRGMKDMDTRKRARGEAGDPFFELTSAQQEKILRYRGAKDLNQAKQAYDKNGNSLYIALGLDEEWYDAYKTKEDAYYDAIFGKSDSVQATYSGAKKPEASEALQGKIDFYNTLPKGTGDRSRYLKSNPDILDHWAKGNQFTDAERIAMGFKVFDDDSGSSTYGGGSSSYASSGKARRGGAGGRGGSKGDYDPTADTRKYAISINAGGSIAKPKITGSAGKKRVKKYTPRKGVASMKVTMKKSKV